MVTSPSIQDSTSPAPAFITSDAPAPTFSLGTLREVLAELEPLHGQRAVRAANIVACRAIVAGASGCLWYVQSESDPSAEYYICCAPGFDLWNCNCRDWQQRGPSIGACKHILAVTILRECEARERGPEPPPLALPFTEDDPDAPIAYALTPRALAVLDAPAVVPAA
jgi:hypothetical protein